MNPLISDLVAQLDLLESQSTKSFRWKSEFDRIMDEITAVNASATALQQTSATPFFRLLCRQNELISALVLLVLIAGQQK